MMKLHQSLLGLHTKLVGNAQEKISPQLRVHSIIGGQIYRSAEKPKWENLSCGLLFYCQSARKFNICYPDERYDLMV